MVLLFRIVVAAIGWFALAFQYWFAMTGDLGPGPLARTINFFSYFTIESNIAVAAAMTLPWLAPRSPLGKFALRPSVRTAIAMYIIFVAVIFNLLLQNSRQLEGMNLATDTLLHFIIPVLFVIDWFFFVPKGTLRVKEALAWLLFPGAYLGWTLIHGALSGFYPYLFVNVGALGYPRVLLNVVGLSLAALVAGILLVGLDRLIARARHASPALPSN